MQNVNDEKAIVLYMVIRHSTCLFHFYIVSHVFLLSSIFLKPDTQPSEANGSCSPEENSKYAMHCHHL